MEITRGGNGAVLVVVLLCALAAGCSEGRARAIRPFFHHGGGLLPPSAVEQHTVRGRLHDLCFLLRLLEILSSIFQ